MRFKNKLTGQVARIHLDCGYSEEQLNMRGYIASGNMTDTFSKRYDSLAEFNEEWEDFEGPGDLTALLAWIKEAGKNAAMSLEVERAVAKLEALNRLEGEGLKFARWTTWEEATGKAHNENASRSYYASFTFNTADRLEEDGQVKSDLDFIFGDPQYGGVI